MAAFRSPRVLITGGAGFIGSHLAVALAGPCEVAVFDNLNPQSHRGNPSNLARIKAAGLRLFQADLRELAGVKHALRSFDPDIIIHLAAETGTGQSFSQPARYTDVNVTGTANLIESMRADAPNLHRIILGSSRAVYGEGAYVDAFGRPSRAMVRKAGDMARGDFQVRDRQRRILRPVATCADCPPEPASIYASSKWMQEQLLTHAFWDSDVQVGILRLQNVYGPSQSLSNPYTGVLSIFADQIRNQQVLNIFEDGRITRDFVFVEDATDAFVQMVLAPRMPQEILDIGAGQHGAEILDIAQRMLALFGQPNAGFRISGAFRPGDIRHAVADISAARKHLGWQPRTPLSHGLARLMRWSAQQQAA
ncbi:MAG: NAD-dependent epimerase/dehydratase family protein [Paracoccaceae bacterium]